LTLLSKIPGTVLILLGALCLSFGGIIVKSFEGANLWQILFWRQAFFSIIVALYLIIAFKKNFFKSFHASGLPGLIAGIFLGIGSFCLKPLNNSFASLTLIKLGVPPPINIECICRF